MASKKKNRKGGPAGLPGEGPDGLPAERDIREEDGILGANPQAVASEATVPADEALAEAITNPSFNEASKTWIVYDCGTRLQFATAEDASDFVAFRKAAAGCCSTNGEVDLGPDWRDQSEPTDPLPAEVEPADQPAADPPQPVRTGRSRIPESFRLVAEALIGAANKVVTQLDAPEVEELQAALASFTAAFEQLTPAPAEAASGTRQRAPHSNSPDLRKAVDTYGVAATGLLRWMGKDGFSREEATAALASFGIHPNHGTVRVNVDAGKRRDGKLGPIPQLEEKHAGALRAFKTKAAAA